MNHRLLPLFTAAFFAALVCVPVARAGEAPATSSGSNFVSGNPNNDGHYTPRKVAQRKGPNDKPGFWDREFKRSGLGAPKWNPVADMKKFLKEKDEAYRAKQTGSDSAAVK